MMLPPKISIIIPVYNVENYLARCLESCITQTLYDIEIVCVDDGSTDRSGEILALYEARDPRVRVFRKKNAGVSAARNDGIRLSTGQWLMFVDSDDYLEPNACEVIWKESLTHEAEIIVHGGFVIPDYPKPESWKYWAVITKRDFFPEFNFDVMTTRGANPFLWLQAFHRDLLERIDAHFEESISFGEDIIFQFETFPFSKGTAFIPDRVYYYRWYREGSLMDAHAADLDARTRRHIDNIAIIADYWIGHGIMDKFGVGFLGWAVGLIIPDLEKLELKDKQALAQHLKEVLEERDLGRFRRKLRHIPARQYRTMLKFAGK